MGGSLRLLKSARWVTLREIYDLRMFGFDGTSGCIQLNRVPSALSVITIHEWDREVNGPTWAGDQFVRSAININTVYAN